MSRSGSETRQRTICWSVRLLPDEAALIRERAIDSGVPMSEFLRTAALGRKTRRTVDSQVINELRRMGGLLKDQFTKSGRQYSSESAATLRQINDAIARIARDGELLNDR